MPLHLYSRAQFPILTISTYLFDTNPEEMEILVTKKIEDAVADVPGIRRIQSISRSGESLVTVQFHVGVDLSDATMEVRSRIRRLVPNLPPDARFPVINHFSPADAPLAVLAVTGDASLEALGEWVGKTLKPRLERVEGISAVRVAGAPDPQIVVDCNTGRLQATGLTIRDVAEAIRTGHCELPGGILVSDGERLAVRTIGSLETVQEISRQPIKVTKGGGIFTVGQVADVSLANEPSIEIVRLNGKNLITVALFRRVDSDLRNLWRSVRCELDGAMRVQGLKPEIEVIFNQAQDLQESLDRLKVLVPQVALITGAVLFLFVGTLSATSVVLAAVPFSLFVALLLMHLGNIRLDLLSLSALALGLGIIVDNSIVVIESVTRNWKEGLETVEGAIQGTADVFAPLLLSTLSTMIVLAPVFFVSQDIRMFFQGFSWSVVTSLAASLIAALVLVPVLFSLLNRIRPMRSIGSLVSARKLEDAYRKVLVFITAHPVMAVVPALVFILIGAVVSRNLTYGQGLAIKPTEFKIFMIMVPGTSQEHVSAEATQVENELLRMPGVKRVYSQVQGSQAQIMVSFAQLTGSTADAVNALSRSVASLAQSGKAQFHIVPMGGGGDEKTISLLFQGPSAEGLFELFSSLSPIFREAPGVKDVIVRQGSPEPAIDMRVRHDLTGFHRVQAADAAHQLRAYLTGPIAAKVTSKERIINVRVRAQRDRADGLAPFQQYLTRSDEGEHIRLSDILDPIQRMRVSELQRENRRPVVRLSLVIEDADPLVVARHVTEALDKSDFPEGYNYAWGDEVHEILRARREMLTAVAMALGLIYIMLAAATNSFVRPVIIMVAVPFAGAGVVMALHLVGVVVNVPVYVGMIVLCGLVINVNIVMIHTMNKRVEAGESPGSAVIEGATRRLRPILMTALTTTLGALPMSIDRGAGSHLWGPLALTISVGVLSSALFSLLLTPLLYSATIRTRSLQGGTATVTDELAGEKLT